MEDDLKKIEINGRRPQKNGNNLKKWKTTPKQMETTQKNMEDKNGKKGRRPKTNLFSILLKFRGKPFLRLAQLSKIPLILLRGWVKS
jgi:hypothetical protein